MNFYKWISSIFGVFCRFVTNFRIFDQNVFLVNVCDQNLEKKSIEFSPKLLLFRTNPIFFGNFLKMFKPEKPERTQYSVWCKIQLENCLRCFFVHIFFRNILESLCILWTEFFLFYKISFFVKFSFFNKMECYQKFRFFFIKLVFSSFAIWISEEIFYFLGKLRFLT